MSFNSHQKYIYFLFILLFSCSKNNHTYFFYSPLEREDVDQQKTNISNSTFKNTVFELENNNIPPYEEWTNYESAKTNTLEKKELISKQFNEGDFKDTNKISKSRSIKKLSNKKSNVFYVIAIVFWSLAAIVLVFLALILATIIFLAPGPITGFSEELNKFILYSILATLTLAAIGYISFLIDKLCFNSVD